MGRNRPHYLPAQEVLEVELLELHQIFGQEEVLVVAEVEELHDALVVVVHPAMLELPTKYPHQS